MCHCQQCQKRTGSTYSAHAYFLKEHVRIEGVPKRFSRSSDSGRIIDFHFCPECGSTMFWEYALRPDAYGIPVGLSADPSFPLPEVAIFMVHKHPWVAMPAGIPQYDGHRPRPETAIDADGKTGNQ